MDTGEFKQRTKNFGIRTIRLVAALPSSSIVPVIARQLVKCSTSVGANYRAACRARSTADFIAKLKIVEEECDESLYWFKVIVEAPDFANAAPSCFGNNGTIHLLLFVRHSQD